MSKMQGLLLFAIVFVVAIGGYFSPIVAKVANLGSSVGATFDTAHTAAVLVNLTNQGANGTSTSILNNSGSNRYVTGVKVACTGLGNSFSSGVGAGLATLQLTVGTSTAATPAAVSSVGAFAPVANAIAIATTATNFVLASATPMYSGSPNSVVWKTGEYMSFWWNSTSTATSTCTEGVDALGG